MQTEIILLIGLVVGGFTGLLCVVAVNEDVRIEGYWRKGL